MNKNEDNNIVQAFAVPQLQQPAPLVAISNAAPLSFDNAEGPRETEVKNYLISQSWPTGLQDTLVKSLKKIKMRYIICDDSGSMTFSGGKIIVANAGTVNMISCSRWAELAQSLHFQAELAHYGSIPTEFRMLNRGVPTRLGFYYSNSTAELEAFKLSFQDSPSGGTPLCCHIREIVREVRAKEQALRQAGQMACLVIATDGEATDGDIMETMRPLKNLPVWIVVRLCTNTASVVDYWNNIDKELELNMDVLDDFQGEAQEIYKHNPWLTYGEPLHRMREFGVHVKEADFLDEQRCDWAQIRILCHIIFGGNIDDYPHPEVDYAGFRSTIQRLNALSDRVFSPINGGDRQPWINLPARSNAVVRVGGDEEKLPRSSLCTVS